MKYIAVSRYGTSGAPDDRPMRYAPGQGFYWAVPSAHDFDNACQYTTRDEAIHDANLIGAHRPGATITTQPAPDLEAERWIITQPAKVLGQKMDEQTAQIWATKLHQPVTGYSTTTNDYRTFEPVGYNRNANVNALGGGVKDGRNSEQPAMRQLEML